MSEIIFNGPAGRLEGRISVNKNPDAPLALILHPNPELGGTMNDKVTHLLYKIFAKNGFTTLRFNFRGVGRSAGHYDNGEGELMDAAAAMDWLQSFRRNFSSCWVAGYSFGAWVGMQLLMRRPEIDNFVALSPPADKQDFTFLAPCPCSGLVVQGNKDSVVEEESVQKLMEKLKAQRGITMDYRMIKGADHEFTDHMPDLIKHVMEYIQLHNGNASELKKVA